METKDMDLLLEQAEAEIKSETPKFTALYYAWAVKDLVGEIQALRKELASARAQRDYLETQNKSSVALYEACKAARDLLEALRMDDGVGNILTEPERVTYHAIAEQLTAALAKVEEK